MAENLKGHGILIYSAGQGLMFPQFKVNEYTWYFFCHFRQGRQLLWLPILAYLHTKPLLKKGAKTIFAFLESVFILLKMPHPHLKFSANQITWSRLLLQIHLLNGKQYRSRSVSFFRNQLIWIYTVCKGRTYPALLTFNFQPIRLLDPDCCYEFTILMANSADPDQMASSEANWLGSTLFAKTGYIWA